MLEQLREKYKTQSEIAKALGVSQMTVSKWLSGKTFPSRRTAQRIADDLGVSLGDVFESSASSNDLEEEAK